MIDWNAPIEAVHTDGRVVAIDRRDTSKRTTDTWWVQIDGRTVIANDKGDVYGTAWTIRNVVEQPAWRTSAEQLDRMDALVQRISVAAGRGVRMVAADELAVVAEAKAIIAAREPIDQDIAIAAQICDRSPYDLTGLADERAGRTNQQIREAVLAGIKYGRAVHDA